VLTGTVAAGEYAHFHWVLSNFSKIAGEWLC
jgi:hypothetical protein